jgi:hypothetical protein
MIVLDVHVTINYVWFYNEGYKNFWSNLVNIISS